MPDLLSNAKTSKEIVVCELVSYVLKISDALFALPIILSLVHSWFFVRRAADGWIVLLDFLMAEYVVLFACLFMILDLMSWCCKVDNHGRAHILFCQ